MMEAVAKTLDPDRNMALWKAVEAGDMEAAAVLIQSDADVNWSNPAAVGLVRLAISDVLLCVRSGSRCQQTLDKDYTMHMTYRECLRLCDGAARC